MDDLSDRLEDALNVFEAIADEHTADEALRLLDDATLQLFWRQWPHVSKWAGEVWRKLNADLAAPAGFDVGSSE